MMRTQLAAVQALSKFLFVRMLNNFLGQLIVNFLLQESTA